MKKKKMLLSKSRYVHIQKRVCLILLVNSEQEGTSYPVTFEHE